LKRNCVFINWHVSGFDFINTKTADEKKGIWAHQNIFKLQELNIL